MQNLKGQDYSWASSIFYFGYLIAQYPSSILMQKLPIGRYFGVMIILWGVATTCQTATTSFATLATCRFFLGVFETCISPVLTILVGQYWTRKEHPLRAVVWWAGAGVGGFVGDGITFAVSGGALQHSHFATWQVRSDDLKMQSDANCPSWSFWCSVSFLLHGVLSFSLRFRRRL